MNAIALSCTAFLAAFCVLVWLLRKSQLSLGLPIAYLTQLMMYHLPGAIVQLISGDFDYDRAEVEIGIGLTAIGAVCFVAGVFLAQRRQWRRTAAAPVARWNFWLFCLAGGWIFTFALRSLIDIPSVSAVVTAGGSLWMLGVLLGLRWAFQRSDMKAAFFWLATLMVFPAVMLLAGGFLSYGAAAVIVVCSALVVTTRKLWRVVAGIALAGVVGTVVFLGYFESRNVIRDAVYHGSSLEDRLNVISDAFSSLQFSDPVNQELALLAVDTRLNQNNFIGLAAERLEHGDVAYLDGTSIEQGLLAFVPRLIWPTKPVFAGSPEIVSRMTGLPLSPNASWGVGNVMEFYINFGYAGLIIGFLLLGWLLGYLDRQAAIAEARGNLGTVLLCFLPGMALIQPLGSMVELSGGTISALLAAYGWQFAWALWNTPGAPRGAAARTPPVAQL